MSDPAVDLGRAQMGDAPAGPDRAPEAPATDDIKALQVLRRGIAMSPGLRRGMPVIAAVGLFAAVGRLIVPVMVQLVLDHGVIGPDGYRPGVVWVLSLAALATVLVVAAASRFALIRLVQMAESVLLRLRVRAFEHIHRLSLATHTESRR
ncbi:MAG: ABC transporter ATP-binding protein, partial [Acidimicrobiaceae bacterium]|nr:ABC transporter ATP-binding protein [Acidimicrobiaceae bacterium]